MEDLLTTENERIYDNKSLMALLGIKDRYLKRISDNGLLVYSHHGDKYWHTQSDIDRSSPAATTMTSRIEKRKICGRDISFNNLI